MLRTSITASVLMAMAIPAVANARTELAAPATPATTPEDYARVAMKRAPAAQPTASTQYCSVYTNTGTRIPRKACATRAEWLAQGVDPLGK